MLRFGEGFNNLPWSSEMLKCWSTLWPIFKATRKMDKHRINNILVRLKEIKKHKYQGGQICCLG